MLGFALIVGMNNNFITEKIMNERTYHKVTFFSPGTFCSEQNIEDIDSWDKEEALERAKNITQRYGAKPYAFQFHTYKVVKLAGWEVKPKLVSESKLFYFNGRLTSYEEVVARNDPEENILRDNMRWNKIDYIVESIDPNNYKWTFEFNPEKDELLNV